MKRLNVIDMFCGGGGESTGIIRAAHDHGFDINLSAINHWERAIETHAANYPFAEHKMDYVENVNPKSLAAAAGTDLLWASPGCQHHSRARGGKPRDEQMRAPAWDVLRFAEILRPKRIIVENVPEFQTWGPLDDAGHPVAEKKGKTFAAFLAALRSLGYTVSYRVLCAADYGAATSRRRLFIQAVRGDCGKRIVWPRPVRAKDGDMFLPKWRAASEVIDWTLPCQPISGRRKPLAAATMRRIEHGIREYWGDYAVPFIAKLYGTSKTDSVDVPVSTISCSGAHHMLIRPFLARYNGGDDRHHRISEPVPTLDTSNRYGVVEPFITEYYGNGRAVPVGIPLPTVTTKDRFAVCGTDGIELGFRMLQPHELAAATGFPAGYKFSGNKGDVVKQIGNAVPPDFAYALVKQALKREQ